MKYVVVRVDASPKLQLRLCQAGRDVHVGHTVVECSDGSVELFGDPRTTQTTRWGTINLDRGSFKPPLPLGSVVHEFRAASAAEAQQIFQAFSEAELGRY